MRFAAIFFIGFLIIGGALLVNRNEPTVVINAVHEQSINDGEQLQAWLGSNLGTVKLAPEFYEEDLKYMSRRFEHEAWQGFLKVTQRLTVPDAAATVTFEILTKSHRVVRRETDARTRVVIFATITAVGKRDPFDMSNGWVPVEKGRDVLITVGRNDFNEIKILDFVQASETPVQ